MMPPPPLQGLGTMGGSTGASPAVSPTPTSPGGSTSGGSSPTPSGVVSASKLREKIAKFEKKGGVPVPRARFGLGVPPPTDGALPKRQGELYGNRIPRSASSGAGYAPAAPLTQTLTGGSLSSFGVGGFVAGVSSRPGSAMGAYSEVGVGGGKRRSVTIGSGFTSPTLSPSADVDEVIPDDDALSLGSEAPTSWRERVARRASLQSDAEKAVDAIQPPVVVNIVQDSPVSASVPLPEDDSQAQVTPPESIPVEEETSSAPPRPTYTTTTTKVLSITRHPSTKPPPPALNSAALQQADDDGPDTPVLSTGDSSLTTLIASFIAANGGEEPSPIPTPGTSDVSSFLAKSGMETPKSSDAGMLLSPPISGMSEVSDSDLSSVISPRPASMAEMHTAEVITAHRINPAVSRAMPTFVPASAKKPTGEADGPYLAVDDDASRAGSDTDLVSAEEMEKRQSAAIAKKRKGGFVSAPSSAAVTRMPSSSATMPASSRLRPVESPISPASPAATGDLASLLQEALFLEDLIGKGDLPSDIQTAEEEAQEARRRKIEDDKRKAEARAREEEKKRIALAAARASAGADKEKEKEAEQKLKHTFLIPLSKARTVHRKEVTDPGVASVPPQVTRKQSVEVTRSTSVLVSGANPSSEDVVSMKSSKGGRFSSFRRLGSSSSSRPPTIHGRSSTTQSINSEISEDSGVIIAPDHGEFGFPATVVSPKKSFAEKMWGRSKSKNGASTQSHGTNAPGVFLAFCRSARG